MNYWNYERAVANSETWVCKAIPWEEAKLSGRHSDRKVTHVYEFLFNTKHREFYSDHSLGNIWLKSCVITIVSPLTIVAQTIYHLIGLGLVKEICKPSDSKQPLSQRCIREVKNIALVPYFGMYQTILAMGIVFCAPFNSEIAFNLRQKIGKLQKKTIVEPYFVDTFQCISPDNIESLIQNKLKILNGYFRGLTKFPVYKSASHNKFVEESTMHPQQRVLYYTRSHTELFRSYRNDYRTTCQKELLLSKLNESYKLLPALSQPSNPRSVTFNLENNVTRPISKEVTYKFIYMFKKSLSASKTKFNSRTKRFLSHTLDDLYEGYLQRYRKKLRSDCVNPSLAKRIGKSVRKHFSTYLKNFTSESDENKKFLSANKIASATKKLRGMTRSPIFLLMLRKDFSMFCKNQEDLRKIKDKFMQTYASS